MDTSVLVSPVVGVEVLRNREAVLSVLLIYIVMARVSRRKTLSHSEIENFLSEINTNDSQTGIGNIDAKPVPYDDFSTTTSAVSTPAVDPMRTEVQLVREFCKVS